MTEELALPASEQSKNVFEELLHYQLFNHAERVRWRMEDVPWSSLDRHKVKPQVVSLVRQIALAELTTYAATRRFLQEFSDDIDFTQWMSVWFYEETKHPQALMRWLSELGEKVSGGEIVRGRITAPFMKSRFAMLVTNVISEVHASAAYTVLRRIADEPVLKQIATHLAGDEARHATGFYAYAQRAFERSRGSEENQLEALKVLHMWLNSNAQVQHPVNTVGLRTSGETELLGDCSRAITDDTILERHSILQQKVTSQRALGLISNLTGIAVTNHEEVMARIRDLTSVVRKSSRN